MGTTRTVSLNQNHLFQRAYRSKLCFVSPFVVTYVVKRRTGSPAVGITAGKKIGGAVQRNRARRVVRAASYDLLARCTACCDIVFVCRKAILHKKSTDLRPILKDHLVRAGVIE